MKSLVQRIAHRAILPIAALLIALAVLLPGLGGYGLWEPHEMQIAQAAAELRKNADTAESPNLADQGGKAVASAKAGADDRGRPNLRERAIAYGQDTFGTGERGSRLPLVGFGLLAIVCAFGLGLRLGSVRAGFYAALVAISMPLVVLSSRQLLGDIVTISGQAALALGGIGLLWPSRREPAWIAIIDLGLVLCGAHLAYHGGGLLVGLLVPLAALAVAAPASLVGTGRGMQVVHDLGWGATRLISAIKPRFALGRHRTPVHPDGAWRAWQTTLVAVLMTIAFFAALYELVAMIYDLSAPIPGDRALFGRSLVINTEHLDALGGQWKVSDDLGATFDRSFEHIAFGMFPWVALAPIAVGTFSMGSQRPDRRVGGYVLFTWALLGWVAIAIADRKIGSAIYPSAIAVAAAIGIWIDDFQRKRSDAAGTVIWPLVGLFVFLGCFVLGKDLQAFPDKMTSLFVGTGTLKYPVGLKFLGLELKIWILVLGAGTGIAFALGVWLSPKSETSRVFRLGGTHGLHLAIAGGVVFAMFLSHAWVPTLAKALSSKHVFSVYESVHKEGEKLGIMGAVGNGASYYAGDDYEKLDHRNALIAFLGRKERVFALAPPGEMCALHRASGTSFSYHVLDDSNVRFLLLSNQLLAGETDKNELARAIVRAEPKEKIKTPLAVNYDNKIELIGMALPSKASRGSSFEMTLVYKVLAPIPGNWKIFVHFDGGNLRFQGDHDPIRGQCGTAFWQPGDYIIDTFQVEAGDVTYAKTAYRAYVGFFTGSAGNWKNMTVVSGEKDDNNRAPVGTIHID